MKSWHMRWKVSIWYGQDQFWNIYFYNTTHDFRDLCNTLFAGHHSESLICTTQWLSSNLYRSIHRYFWALQLSALKQKETKWHSQGHSIALVNWKSRYGSSQAGSSVSVCKSSPHLLLLPWVKSSLRQLFIISFGHLLDNSIDGKNEPDSR